MTDREKLARYLADRLEQDGSGISEDRVYNNRPRDIYFIGTLSPLGDKDAETLENEDEFYSRLAPSALQIRFLYRGSGRSEFRIRPSFHTYYRVLPSLSGQRERSESVIKGVDRSEECAKVFQKFSPALPVISFTLGELQEAGKLSFQLDEVEASLRMAAEADESSYRADSRLRFTAQDLESEESYAAKLRSFRSNSPSVPQLRISIEVTLTLLPDGLAEISVGLVNRSREEDPAGVQRLIDEYLFNAQLEVSHKGGEICPHTFVNLPKSYRYQRSMHGSGVNCNVEAEGNPPIKLRSVAMPRYFQKRLVPNQIDGGIPYFRDLKGERALSVLRAIRDAMKSYDNTGWAKKRAELVNQSEDLTEFENDRKTFQKEIERFGRGIEVLENNRYAILLRAFYLMNRVFETVGASVRVNTYDSWHLFQIVFIVSMLPELAAREWPQDFTDLEDVVDVLWFPTGGGKTEAYLGLIVLALFFDRLRGRDRGVTALLRFPLRLLSLQQFQRIVRVLAIAELVRREEELEGDVFAIGHWIGEGGSPNEVKEAEGTEYAEKPALIQGYLKIAYCPFCDGKVGMKFDIGRWWLQHVCENPDCHWYGTPLPLYIVDRELYRSLPSVIVGTVDKLAVLGMQRRFMNLMGWPGKYCPSHGFTTGDDCEVPHCQEQLREGQLKDPVPSLHIQDELHLLKEDLGTFDGHYESALLSMQKEVSGGTGKTWKLIAASATIEGYDHHSTHLYLKNGRRFPGSGPEWDETFYARSVDDIGRIFMGVMSHNRTHINSMVSLLYYVHREIQRLRNMAVADIVNTVGFDSAISRDELARVLDDFDVSLTYVLTKKAADQMAESLESQVNLYLKESNLQPITHALMTGGTTSAEITEVMRKIEQTDPAEQDWSKRIHSVIATSMISHGVDVDRFNCMLFFGMPRMNAEYIQAASRVGRKNTGIVVICFAPARERDQSHYHLFGKFHEYIERLVEPAAINRWSKFSIDKTLPGVFIGYVTNCLSRAKSRKMYVEQNFANYVSEPERDTLTEKIISFYGAKTQQSGLFMQAIRERLDVFYNSLRPKSRKMLWEKKGWKPMRSLRDVDETIPFYPTNYSSEVFQMTAGKTMKDRPGELQDDRFLSDK